MFRSEPYEIRTAESAPAALELFASGTPVRAVISDYRMPVMNGVDVMRALKGALKGAFMPVIVLTAHEGAEVRMRALGAEVRAVESGARTLKDAMNEALRDWVTNVADTHYVIGSAVGPAPYPEIVAELQSVIGRETRAQVLEYEGRLPVDAKDRLLKGVELEDGIGRVSGYRELPNNWLELKIHEGRYHIIRRLMEAIDLKVIRLVRSAFGPILLGDLKEGRWRDLNSVELANLYTALNI